MPSINILNYLKYFNLDFILILVILFFFVIFIILNIYF